MTFHSALYTGDLVHTRRDVHARRTFRYPVYMAALDLAELPTLDRTLHLFSYGRANLFSLRDEVPHIRFQCEHLGEILRRRGPRTFRRANMSA